MTIDEFKAWFEGYTEEIQGRPTTKQWEKIKQKISEVHQKPIITTTPYPTYSPNLIPELWSSTTLLTGTDTITEPATTTPLYQVGSSKADISLTAY